MRCVQVCGSVGGGGVCSLVSTYLRVLLVARLLLLLLPIQTMGGRGVHMGGWALMICRLHARVTIVIIGWAVVAHITGGWHGVWTRDQERKNKTQKKESVVFEEM